MNSVHNCDSYTLQAYFVDSVMDAYLNIVINSQFTLKCKSELFLKVIACNRLSCYATLLLH
jgi:hypothetical protein